MAYVSKEAKATIAQNLKPVLARYGVKATLAVSMGRTIVLNIRSGAIDFLAQTSANTRGGYISVNPYWYRDHFTGDALAFLTDAMAALQSAGWYDRTDMVTDYFDTAYYVEINVGTWQKPYQLTAVRSAA
jgi:hypothetical protein